MSNFSRLPQRLRDSLNGFKKRNPEIWEDKYRIATERILSSIFFFVSAKRCYYEGNKLLSAIGYYYSLFHLSKALLFLLPKYAVDELKFISHKKVLNLVLTDFVQRKILSSRFFSILDYFHDIRVAVNYSMGSWISLYKILRDEEPKLLSCIDEGISVFKEICKDNIWLISTIIGDGIGDDWLDSYLSKNERDEVASILLKYDLTTYVLL